MNLLSPGRKTNLGVLGPLESWLVWGFGETETGQARRDDMETGVVLSACGQKRKHLSYFEEVSWP